MRTAIAGILLALPLVLASCSMSSGHANFDLKDIPGTTVAESETDFAMISVGGRYRLHNNPWNRGVTSGRYRQKIFVKDDGGKPIYGWAWRWRDSSGVTTYPEIQAGISPWNGEAASDTLGFPFKAGSKKLVVNYDVAMEASGKYNLAFEFWAVSSLPPSKATISHEVMIWIAAEALGAAGSEVDKPTIGGRGYSVCLMKNHGDDSGQYDNTWTIISILADQPLLHGPLDVGEIIDYLLQKKYLDPRVFIANLELGNEVVRGSGTTLVRNYDVKVE
jgi:hypothetical protein